MKGYKNFYVNSNLNFFLKVIRFGIKGYNVIDKILTFIYAEKNILKRIPNEKKRSNQA